MSTYNEQLAARKNLRDSHAARCESQGHEWENCCSLWLEIYQCCKWCGATK